MKGFSISWTSVKPFDYLSSILLLFTAITLGELTMGLAYALNGETYASFYLPHSMFMGATFFGSIDYATRIYSLRKVGEWRFISLALILIPGMLWLLGTKLLLPEIDPPTKYDFYAILQENKSRMYLIVIVYIVSAQSAFHIVYKTIHKTTVWIYAAFIVISVYCLISLEQWTDYLMSGLSLLLTLVLGLWKGSRLRSTNDSQE